MTTAAVMTTEFVNYHDAVLYLDADTRNFRSGGWLNDNCINFIFRYLQYQELPPELGADNLRRMLFLDCSVLSCLLLSIDEPEELQQLAEGLDLQSRSLIFAPVNDNADFTSGSHHWSLLVVSVSPDRVTYLHFDSSNTYNAAAAERAAAHLHVLLGRADGTSDSNAPQVYHVKGAPQQTNSSDCGMYTALGAREVARFAAARGSGLVLSASDSAALAWRLCEQLTPEAVARERGEMLAFAQMLPHQKQGA